MKNHPEPRRGDGGSGVLPFETSPPNPLSSGAGEGEHRRKKKLRVVCGPELARGFALAGLTAIEAATPEEGGRRLEALIDQADAGVVLVEEPFYAALPEEARRRLGRRPLPMVVPFPAPAWRERASPEAYVVEILRQAIGYRVRLR